MSAGTVNRRGFLAISAGAAVTGNVIVDLFAKAIQGMKPEDAVAWATGELKKIYEA